MTSFTGKFFETRAQAVYAARTFNAREPHLGRVARVEMVGSGIVVAIYESRNPAALITDYLFAPSDEIYSAEPWAECQEGAEWFVGYGDRPSPSVRTMLIFPAVAS